jgi:Putative transposase
VRYFGPRFWAPAWRRLHTRHPGGLQLQAALHLRVVWRAAHGRDGRVSGRPLPVRQWVLSLPIPRHRLLAEPPELLKPVLRILHCAHTHIVLMRLEFMQRLAALMPRPRLHLVRFLGVQAPNAKRRPQAVPRPCGDCGGRGLVPARTQQTAAHDMVVVPHRQMHGAAVVPERDGVRPTRFALPILIPVSISKHLDHRIPSPRFSGERGKIGEMYRYARPDGAGGKAPRPPGRA